MGRSVLHRRQRLDRDSGLSTQSAVQDTLGARWLHPRMRNEEITRAFVRDIATNHLPHI
jgi:hypothetical protein